MGMYDEVFGESSSSANGGLYDDVFKENAKKQNKGIAGDTLTDLKRGVQQIPGAVTGIADIVNPLTYATGNRMADTATDWLGDKTGFKPSQWQKEAANEYSPERKASDKAISDAWENGSASDIAGSYLSNPRSVAGVIGQSIPSMIAGGGIARAGMKGIAALSGADMAALGKAAQFEGAAGNAARETINKMATTAGAIGEGAITAGQNMDQVSRDVDPSRAALTSLAAGAITGGIGKVSGRIANKLGLPDVETAMAGGGLNAGNMPWYKRIPSSMAQESLIQELPQSAQEQVWQNIAENKPWHEGVARQAIEGALAGAAMGGGAAIPSQNRIAPIPEPATLPEDGPLSSAVNAGIRSGATSLNAAEQFRQRADVIPAGSFGQMNEFADLVNSEQADLTNRREAVRDTIPYERTSVPSTLSLAAEAQRQDGIPFEGSKPQAPDWSVQGNGSFSDQAELANLIESEKSDVGQRRAEVTNKTNAARAERSQQAIAGDMAQDELAPKPVSPLEKLIASRTDEQLTRLAGQGQRKEVQQAAIAEMQRRMSAPAQPTTTAPQQQAATQFNIPENINAPKAEQVAQEAPQANDAQVGAQPSAASSIQQLQAELDKAEPFTERSSELTDKLHSAVTQDAQSSIDAGEMPVYKVTDHVSVAIHPSAQNPGMVQVTRYTKDGVIGDSQYNNIEEAVRFEGLTHKPRIAPDAAAAAIEKSIQAESEYQARKNAPKQTGPDSSQSPTKVENSEHHPAIDVKPTGQSTIAKRDDLVGAIMRVTGGKGIAANQAQTIVGDKANAATKVRGLFTNDGTADLGDVAMLLRDEEGYSVKDGEHLSELIREQAAGNPVHSMERTEREASANAEKEYKASVNQKATELGLKKVGGKRTLQVVEADIAAKEKEISELEAREERAAIQTSVIAEDIYQEGSELTESDLMQWLGGHIDYSQDEINEANTRASERESRRAEKNAADDSQEQAQSRNSEGAGTGSTEAGTRSTEGEQLASEDIVRRAKALGMKTAGVSADRLAKQVEEAEARNAFDLTKQTNEQASAEFKRQQEEANKQDEEPASPTVNGDQIDLINTQDALFSNNREQPSGVEDEERFEREMRSNASTEQSADDDIQTSGLRYVQFAKAIAIARKAVADGVKMFPAQFHSRLDVTMNSADRLIAALKEEAKPATVEAEKAPSVAAGNDKPEAITDFGEKLEGAKKDRTPSLSKDLSDDDIATQPLSKIWPAAEIDDIENTFAAAVAFSARNEIPAKPRKSYLVARWVEKVKMLRSLAAKIVSIGEDKARDIWNKKISSSDFKAKVVLLEAIDRDQWKRIGAVSEHPTAYRFNNDGSKETVPFVNVEIDGKRQMFEGAKSVADVVEKVNGLLGVEQQAKKMQFEVRGYGDRYFINKKGDKEHRRLKEFTNTKDAFAFIKNNYDDLVAAWDGVKDRDNVTKADVRNAENRPRTGSDWRNGKDVTAEQFQDAFGFRGGQFGKWVTQGNSAKERQWMLNQSYDALMDLASIVGIPPKAISLNGSLGLAFGARGSGNAAAHFEPDTLVINLTKTKGAGSLAHEWFHALDNYFSRQRGGEVKIKAGLNAQQAYRTQNFITYRPEPMMIHKTRQSTPITRAKLMEYHTKNQSSEYYNPENWHVDPKHPAGVRPEVERSFAELVEALDASPMKSRAAMNDKAADGYWSRIIERGARSFENFVIFKMMENGYSNDYLANVREVQDFPRAKERYPYLLPEEVAPIAEAFDNLFSTIQTKETNSGIAMYSKGNAQGQVITQPQAESRILSLLGNKLGQVLLDSGIITFTNKGNAYQGATYKNGNIALNLDNLTADNFDGVLQHEGLHSTLREYIGEETYSKLMKQLDTLLKMGKGSKWVEAANASVPKDTTPENVTEEIAAYSVEQHVNGGKLPGVLKRWAQDFLSTLRTAIIKSLPNGKLKTWAISNITAQDLSKLAIAGLKAKAAGQLQAQGREAMAFSAKVEIDDLHGKFWSSIKAGTNSFTKDEIYGAYASGRRGTNRKGELDDGSGKSLSSPEAARVAAEWDENIAGFKGYVTTATWLKGEDGLDAFYVSVIPKELWGKTNPLNNRSLDNASITQYAFSEMPDGTYDLHINDVAKGSDVERLLKQNNRLEVNKENPAYQHAVLDNRYTESRALMQEAIRRLALATNIVPTITQTERDTGARAGSKEFRIYQSDKVETKFSKINQTATEAFKKWFGDSKVVDADGNPLMVYHGTTADVSAFNLSYAGSDGVGYSVPAIFATTDKSLASDYSVNKFNRNIADAMRGMQLYKNENPGVYGDEYEQHYQAVKTAFKTVKNGRETGIGANVIPAYMSIRNPLVIDAEGKLFMAVMPDGIAKASANGHDGLIVKNVIDHASPSSEHPADVYIAFKPTQIKSAIGNNGDFNASNPDIRYSKAAQIIGDSGRPYDKTQRDFFKNVGRDINPQTRIEKAADYLKNDFWKKMAIGIVDQFRGLRDLNDNGQAYMLARLSKGTAGAFDALLHHGKLSLKDGVYDADTSGGFVERLGAPLNGELDDVLWWIAANRAEGLAAQGKENLFSPQDIAAGKSLATGKTNFDYTMQTGPLKGKTTRDRAAIYADANRVFNEFQKNTLDMAEQSGLIDGASRQYWESEFYVPFYRVSEEDGEFIGSKMGNALVRQQAFKKLKGGTDKLNSDLLSNTLLNWSHLIEASAKNRAAKASLTAAEKIGAAQRVASNMGEYAASNGAILPPGTKKTVWFQDKGQKQEYLVTDPFVMTAITSLEYAGMRNGIMDVLTKFKHYLTIGVTASPAFKVRNLIRDSIQAIGTSDLSYNPIKNVTEGFKQTKRDSQEYVSALASGGLIRFGTMLENSESDRVRQLIKAGVKDSTILNSEDKWQAFYDQYLDPAISAYNELGNRSEEITRAALFNQLIKNGKSHAEAALLARDLMDFSMQGSFNTIRFLTQTVPFLNARLVGMYKLGRAAKENPKKMAIVTGVVALAGMSLLLAYGDDDDWKKREDWDLNNFFWFKFGDVAFRIPRPFEIGAVASLAERSLQYMIDDEMTGERFRKVVGHLLMDNLSMNPTPQAIKPIVDLYANRDSFTGRPIETMGMDKLDPTERYTSNTSMVARGASKALMGAASPVQIDHLARSYFGWIGSFVVGGADMAARAMNDEPTKPTLDYFKFSTQGIVSEANSPSSRYVTNIYDQAKELEQAYGTWRRMIKEGKIEDAQEYAADNRDKLNRYKSVESVKKIEAKFTERIRQIERSNIDPDEKKSQIANVNRMKDFAARRLTPGYSE